MSTYKIGIESDITRCESLWKSISSNETLVDFWEYRMIWHQIFSDKGPIFIYVEEDKKIVALLPLDHLPSYEGHWAFFGEGDHNEQLHHFAKDSVPIDIIETLYSYAPDRFIFHSIPKDWASKIPSASEEIETYYIDCKELNHSIENLFLSMSTKSRKNIRYDLRSVEDLHPVIVYNHYEDVEFVFEYNKAKFGTESMCAEPNYCTAFRNMISSPDLHPFIRTISVLIEGKVVASAICANYKKDYIYFISAYEPSIENLGKFIIYQVLIDGMNSTAERIYAYSCDYGWKERWGLKKESLFCVVSADFEKYSWYVPLFKKETMK